MVESTIQLNSIFGCLSDPTRRDILSRVSKQALTVSEIAQAYDLTLAAISKHLQVLEKAKLVFKRREGKQQYVQLAPATLKEADTYLKRYEALWNDRIDSLEAYLKNNP